MGSRTQARSCVYETWKLTLELPNGKNIVYTVSQIFPSNGFREENRDKIYF